MYVLRNWPQGEDLIEVSSQLIYQGDAMRVTTGMWTNNITLFLFDHQLVYCKKDILKRNTYIYKGRIYLDTSEVIDVPDGKGTRLSDRLIDLVYHCISFWDEWQLLIKNKRYYLIVSHRRSSIGSNSEALSESIQLRSRQMAALLLPYRRGKTTLAGGDGRGTKTDSSGQEWRIRVSGCGQAAGQTRRQQAAIRTAD